MKELIKIDKQADTAKAALGHVVRVLNAGGPQSCFLWDILSALRGPDNNNEGLKEVTTIRIRRIVGVREGEVIYDPFTRGFSMRGFRSAFVDKSGRAPVASHLLSGMDGALNPYGPVENHFRHHVVMAVNALTALGYELGDKA